MDAVAQAALLADLGEQPGAHAAAQHAHRAPGLEIVGMPVGDAAVGDADLRLLRVVGDVPVLAAAGCFDDRSAPAAAANRPATGRPAPPAAPTRRGRPRPGSCRWGSNDAGRSARMSSSDRLPRPLARPAPGGPRDADSGCAAARSSPSPPARPRPPAGPATPPGGTASNCSAGRCGRRSRSA